MKRNFSELLKNNTPTHSFLNETVRSSTYSNAPTQTDLLFDVIHKLSLSTLKELHKRNLEIELLKELSATLQTCSNLDETYKIIASFAAKLLPDSSGALYLLKASTSCLEAVTSWGEPHLFEKALKVHDCLALRRGIIYKVENPQKDLVCAHYDTKNTNPYNCIPLLSHGELLGLLYLEWQKECTQNEENSSIYDNQELIGSMLADQIALGLSNIKLSETLNHYAFRDPLTGLYNRRYLEESLERELFRCARNSECLTAFMIDIDLFKQFNEIYSHEVGDQMLEAIAETLHHVSRKEDMICRLESDKFIIVMPNLNTDAALHRSLEFHNAINQIKLNETNQSISQITVSIGIASYPIMAQTMTELLIKADEALCFAKKSGNTTELYKKQ